MVGPGLGRGSVFGTIPVPGTLWDWEGYTAGEGEEFLGNSKEKQRKKRKEENSTGQKAPGSEHQTSRSTGRAQRQSQAGQVGAHLKLGLDLSTS